MINFAIFLCWSNFKVKQLIDGCIKANWGTGGNIEGNDSKYICSKFSDFLFWKFYHDFGVDIILGNRTLCIPK